jgi:WbqC-like protein family
MNNSQSLIIESHYLPCVEYFYFLSKHDIIYLEAFENFQKQTHRNRCEILGANKVDILTVPVIKASGQKKIFKEVEIDYSQNWHSIHWRAMESAYRNSPYFEFYFPYFQDILFKKYRYLIDLNVDLMTLCLKLLRWDKEIRFTKCWEKEYNEEMKDLRSKIHPSRDKNSFIQKWKPYRQVFGNNFVKNLSILDLLFNEGPDSVNNLRELNTEENEQM